MQDAAIEAVLELLTVGVETVLFAVLTAVGVVSEQMGVAGVTSGETVGYWYVYVGVIALYAGLYLLGYKRLLPRVRERLAGA